MSNFTYFFTYNRATVGLRSKPLSARHKREALKQVRLYARCTEQAKWMLHAYIKLFNS